MCVYYDLRGLRLIVIGSIVTMVLSVVDSLISAVDESAAFLVLPLELVGWVITIVGVFKCSRINERFRKAKTFTLITILLSAAALAALFLFLVNAYWPDENESLGDASFVVGLISLAALVLFFLAILIISFICVYQLLYGCRDIALMEGEQYLAQKCRSIWTMYIWASIGGLLFFVIALGSIAALETVAMVFFIIGMICGIVVLVAEIRLLMCFWRFWKTYHGKPVGGKNIPLPEQPVI